VDFDLRSAELGGVIGGNSSLNYVIEQDGTRVVAEGGIITNKNETKFICKRRSKSAALLVKTL